MPSSAQQANLCLFLGRAEIPGFGEDFDETVGEVIEQAAPELRCRVSGRAPWLGLRRHAELTFPVDSGHNRGFEHRIEGGPPVRGAPRGTASP